MTTKLTETTNAFLKELRDFDYGLSCLDRIWNVLFPDRKEGWNHLHVCKYQQTFYVSHVDDMKGHREGLEIDPKGIVKAMAPMGRPRSFGNDEHLASEWEELISSARRWLKAARRWTT